MTSRLQKQRVGDDRTDRRKCQRAGNHVFRTMKQHALHEAALRVRVDRDRFCTRATTSARHVVLRILSRHFSSPGELGPGLRIAE
jgi:hypothetical protein